MATGHYFNFYYFSVETYSVNTDITIVENHSLSGVPGRESNPGLPFSRSSRYYLMSYAFKSKNGYYFSKMRGGRGDGGKLDSNYT